MSVKKVSRSALVAAILLSGLGFLIATPTPASAAVGKVTAGSPTFTGLGGVLAVGAGGTPVSVPTLHPDRPAQCADGVDNEVGSRQSGGGSIVPAPDGLIDNGSDPQCTSAADDDESLAFTGSAGGFQNTATCDNRADYPANPQPRKNWTIPSTVAVVSGTQNSVTVTPSAVTVPDNILLQGSDQVAGLDLQIVQNVKPLAFNTKPPRGNNGDPCARTFTDGVLNGTTTITSATAAFNNSLASDVGAFISGPGIPPNTTITSDTATSAVMSQAATTSATGVTVTIGGHGGTNGVTNAGLNTLGGSGFSTLDIGALVWSANVPVGTTIVSINSGTEAVMSNNATVSGTSQAYTVASRPYQTACAGGSYVGKTNWFGVSNSDGSGSLDICVYVELNIHELSATIAPDDTICRTDAFPIHLTTGTDGSLTGVPYDTTKQTLTMVATNFTIPLTTAANGGTIGQLVCDGVNSQVGFPSGPANNQLSMVTSTANGPWPPVAAITSPTTINVNEGDVVTLGGDFANSYDPGSRTLTEVGWTRTGGTASAPAATGGTTTNKTFVAPDAPSGGNTHLYSYCVSAPLIAYSMNNDPANTSPEQGCKSVTVNVANVAPTANAGLDRTVNGGQAFSLTGTSVDPGDADLPGQRGYCWTQTGGTSVGLPACSGSPLNNRPSAGGKFTALSVTPANANDTETFSLTVCDKDGACSTADTATITVKATTASQINGTVNVCTPGCVGAGAGAVTVNLYRDGVGLIGTTQTAAGGSYSFPGLAAGGGYRVGFTGTGLIAEYWNDAKWATEGDAITVPSAIINADLYGLGQGKSITGTVSQLAGGNAPDGTAVRLYDESGFVGNTTTSGGAYSFTFLQPKSTYKVDFARGSATLAETWSGGAFSAPNATAVNVTSSSQVVNITLNNKGISANGQGDISGTVTDGSTGVAGIQVRAYDFTTGSWIASVNTDGSGNYTFSGTNFGTNVNGLAPGSYKLWFWNVNQTGPGGGLVWCSVWDGGNIRGGQYQGSGKLVTTAVNVTANVTTTDNKVLASDTTTNCPK